MSSRAAEIGLAPEITARLVAPERLQAAAGRRSSGIAALDRLLGGGWPRAAVSEISGRRSSGRTAAVLAALAQTIAAGEAAAVVDVGGTLDVRAAAACGIATHALLWIRCAPAQALRAADLVAAAGGFGLLCLDLCDAQAMDARWRIPDAAWVRLRHTARNQGTTVLVASAGRTLGAYAAAAVELDGATPAFLTDGPALFAGLRTRAIRRRGAPLHDHPSTEEQPACVSLALTSRS